MNNGMAALCNLYSYDPLDRLASSRSGAQRFYHGQRLFSERHGDAGWSLVQASGRLLGQRNHDERLSHALLATDGSQSVMAVADESGQAFSSYSPYGERATPAADRYPGFNGQRNEAQTGWYLLGNGYRAFNPGLHRFHSPDSFSPFGGGGLNPYVYCSGDPINFSDPTGHSSTGTWLTIGLGVALSAIGAAITVLSAGTATAPYAASVASVLSITAGIGSTATGIAGAVVGETSSNQGAAQVLGYISMGLGGISLVAGLGSAAITAGDRMARAFAQGLSGRAAPAGRLTGNSFDEIAGKFDALSGRSLASAVRATPGSTLFDLADSSQERAQRIFPLLRSVHQAMRIDPASSALNAVGTDTRALNVAKSIVYGDWRGVMPFQLNEAGVPPHLPIRLGASEPSSWAIERHEQYREFVNYQLDDLLRTRNSFL